MLHSGKLSQIGSCRQKVGPSPTFVVGLIYCTLQVFSTQDSGSHEYMNTRVHDIGLDPLLLLYWVPSLVLQGFFPRKIWGLMSTRGCLSIQPLLLNEQHTSPKRVVGKSSKGILDQESVRGLPQKVNWKHFSCIFGLTGVSLGTHPKSSSSSP